MLSTRMPASNLAPYLLLVPSMLFLLLFFASPMAQAFALALQDPDGRMLARVLQTMVGHPNFRRAVHTTLVLLVVVVPVQFVLAAGHGPHRQQRLRGSGLWLYVYALPLAISESGGGPRLGVHLHRVGLAQHHPAAVGILDRQRHLAVRRSSGRSSASSSWPRPGGPPRS